VSDAGNGPHGITEERQVLADDLRLLAFLHDKEIDAATLKKLRAEPFASWLGLRLAGSEARAALDFLDQALAELPDEIDAAIIDRLAVDFARIYLHNHYGASPDESVWLTEENIVRQEPMFQVRTHYKRYGLEAENWRERADDHLVMQLSFLAHLVGVAENEEALPDAARFLDRHLLIWIKDFASVLAGRAEQKFYVGLALATACYLDELRDYLTDLTGEARRDAEFREEAFRRLRAPTEEAGAVPPTPVIGPGW